MSGFILKNHYDILEFKIKIYVIYRIRIKFITLCSCDSILKTYRIYLQNVVRVPFSMYGLGD
jgi:hypothetical protein